MIGIEVIEKCNFRCIFCLPNGVKKEKLMSLELFKRLIDEAVSLGISDIDLTPSSGELFLHPDAYEILDYSLINFNKVTLYTNLSTLNFNSFLNIYKHNLNLNVSFYGNTFKNFNIITQGSEEQFNDVNNNINLLNAHHIEYTLLSRDNLEFYNNTKPQEGNFKCAFHYRPVITVDGNVMFCTNLHTNPIGETAYYDSVLNKSLKDVLTNPLRYAFYQDQSFCKTKCPSYTNPTDNHSPTFNSLKLMQISKSNGPAELQEFYNRTRICN